MMGQVEVSVEENYVLTINLIENQANESQDGTHLKMLLKKKKQ